MASQVMNDATANFAHHSEHASEPTFEQLRENLADVAQRIEAAVVARAESKGTGWQQHAQLVAVSKMKSPQVIQQAFSLGCHRFGEAVLGELVQKAHILRNCEIMWHYLGHLRVDDAETLIREVPGLDFVETVDSLELAKALDNVVASVRPQRPLNILVQVNLLGGRAPGIKPDAVFDLVDGIFKECKHLQFRGLMAFEGNEWAKSFQELVRLRDELKGKVPNVTSGLDLSIGMSYDFEEAISAGATIVRVGTCIFGPRPKSLHSHRQQQQQKSG